MPLQAVLRVAKEHRKLAHAGKLLKSECVEGKTREIKEGKEQGRQQGLTPNQELGFYLEGTGKRLGSLSGSGGEGFRREDWKMGTN